MARAKEKTARRLVGPVMVVVTKAAVVTMQEEKAMAKEAAMMACSAVAEMERAEGETA